MLSEGTPKGFGTAGGLWHDSSNPKFYSHLKKWASNIQNADNSKV
jgi:hypothetical protein